MSSTLIVVFVAMFILLALAALTFVQVMNSLTRKQKFDTRVSGALSENQNAVVLVQDNITLTKVVSRTDIIQTKAADLVGLDIKQTDTYPIKWWLVPPLTLLISWILTELAAKAFGHQKLILIIIWPVAWFLITKITFIWFNNRRNSQLLNQFPDALGTVVRCVRVGIPMGEALRTVARDSQEPTKTEFTILADKVAIGIPIDVALRELSERIKLTEYQFFATAITLQLRAGGAITQTLETLADVIRKRVALKARGFALTAEARMSSMILAVLPFLTGGALFFMNRPYINLLFFTQSGQKCLGAAVLLMGLGLGTIQFMISNVLK